VSWSYRAVKIVEGDEEVWRVHEVFYDKKGRIDKWTVDPIYAQGDSLENLKADLSMMLRDVETGPVLYMEELERLAGREEGK